MYQLLPFVSSVMAIPASLAWWPERPPKVDSKVDSTRMRALSPSLISPVNPLYDLVSWVQTWNFPPYFYLMRMQRVMHR